MSTATEAAGLRISPELRDELIGLVELQVKDLAVLDAEIKLLKAQRENLQLRLALEEAKRRRTWGW